LDSQDQDSKPDVIRILMIDDDESDFFLTCVMLSKVESQKYDFQWISNYREGLGAMLDGQYDVCLVDNHLGPDSGLELMKEAFQKGCRKPVIMMTGQGDYKIDVEAIRCGAMDYLTKGQTGTGVLERTIRHAMTHWRVLEKLKAKEEECARLEARLEDVENRKTKLTGKMN